MIGSEHMPLPRNFMRSSYELDQARTLSSLTCSYSMPTHTTLCPATSSRQHLISPLYHLVYNSKIVHPKKAKRIHSTIQSTAHPGNK